MSPAHKAASMLRSWDWYLSLRPTTVRRTEILAAGGGDREGGRVAEMACWGKRAARVCLAEMGMRRAHGLSGDRGCRCRKKGGSSVAARPTREAQWESILRAFIQPHKFTFVMNKLH